jgi:hypothetical protein
LTSILFSFSSWVGHSHSTHWGLECKSC